MNDSSATSCVLSAVIAEFEKLKQQADAAIAQLGDDDLFFQLNEDQNSISVIMKHMAGNMLSRWKDFRSSDGEKPDRHRDEEFIERRVSRSQLVELWERGWARLLEAMRSIQPDELQREITIRQEKMSLFSAINRQTAHYGYHIGQMILLAKHIRGAEWKYLTIPRGRSENFNLRIRTQNEHQPS